MIFVSFTFAAFFLAGLALRVLLYQIDGSGTAARSCGSSSART